jgi:hypothetical protein
MTIKHPSQSIQKSKFLPMRFILVNQSVFWIMAQLVLYLWL